MKQLNIVVWRVLSLIFMLAIVQQFATDCYLPSFPEIANTFNVSHAAVQLSLTIFLAGQAVAQLFFGPLSDLYGRRSLLIFGLIIFTGSSLLCAFAPTIHSFLMGRLIQGLGAGSGVVIARAIARDLFSDVKFAQVLSSLAAIIVLMQLISPVVGGYTQHYFGWHAVFILITILSSLLLLIIFFAMPETFPSERRIHNRMVYF